VPDERPRRTTGPNECARMRGGNVCAAQAVATLLECSEGTRARGVPDVSDTDTNGTIADGGGCSDSSVDPSFARFPIAQVVSEPIHTGGEPTMATWARSPRWSKS
jgi:hypothetical protein